MSYRDSEGNDLEEFNSPEKIRELIDSIRKVESSDGKLLNHRTIASGEQTGLKAAGQYGFTPVGFFDAARVKGERDKDQELKNLGSIVQKDSEVPLEDRQMLLENLVKARPDLEEKLIRDLASRLLVRQRGDVGRAVEAFEGNPYQKFIPEEKIRKSERLKRLSEQFGRDLRPIGPPKSEELPISLKKR